MKHKPNRSKSKMHSMKVERPVKFPEIKIVDKSGEQSKEQSQRNVSLNKPKLPQKLQISVSLIATIKFSPIY